MHQLKVAQHLGPSFHDKEDCQNQHVPVDDPAKD